MKNLILFAFLVLFAACTKQSNPEPQTETVSFSVSSFSNENGSQTFIFGEDSANNERFAKDHGEIQSKVGKVITVSPE